jgi:hypothetical protein
MMSAPVEAQLLLRTGEGAELFDRKLDRGGAAAGCDVSLNGQTFPDDPFGTRKRDPKSSDRRANARPDEFRD